jgi:SAM-dependent methyltransferase
MATPVAGGADRPVAECLAELLDHLGIARAHFAGRSLADLQGFIAAYPQRLASLTLLCPAVLNPRSLAPLGARVLVVTGDHGLGTGRVRAVLPNLPAAASEVLEDYAGLTWADLAAERGAEIDAALRDLSPGQWEPLIPALSARHSTITLGGALFGSVASLEERGRSGYMAVVRGLLDALAIRPGESVLEVGCGSGVIMRELARRTAGANRLIGRDMSRYLLGEAQALARRAGLLDHIDFGEGRAEALPLPDGAVDVALSSTVFEEGDADLMLAEIVRVTRPGGRIGIIVRAIDMPFWVNLPLDAALKAKVDAPNMIGGGVAAKGVADASLYRRLAALGLRSLRCFPQLVPVVPGSERIERYQQQILARLTPAEAVAWHHAVTAAERDGTFFIAQPYHCAVATKPG